MENHATDPAYPLPAVLRAYRFLGLGGLADRVASVRVPAPDATPDERDEAEERADEAYDVDDDRLAEVVRLHVEDHPGEYGPV